MQKRDAINLKLWEKTHATVVFPVKLGAIKYREKWQKNVFKSGCKSLESHVPNKRLTTNYHF